MNQIGQRIAVERKRRHMSQKELARIVGISQASISRLERGKDWPVETRHLARIANALDKPLSELVPESLADELLPTADAHHFYAFCPNPFCEANAIERSKDGGPVIYWKSGSSFQSDRFPDINFCQRCGTELVKECPSCKRRLEQPGTRFCMTCGKEVTNRPTSEEWAKVNRMLGQRSSPIEEEDFPF